MGFYGILSFWANYQNKQFFGWFPSSCKTMSFLKSLQLTIFTQTNHTQIVLGSPASTRSRHRWWGRPSSEKPGGKARHAAVGWGPRWVCASPVGQNRSYHGLRGGWLFHSEFIVVVQIWSTLEKDWMNMMRHGESNLVISSSPLSKPHKSRCWQFQLPPPRTSEPRPDHPPAHEGLWKAQSKKTCEVQP